MTVLAAIGDIQRFETAQHLASYSGLTPGLEQSGTKRRGKGITKEAVSYTHLTLPTSDLV